MRKGYCRPHVSEIRFYQARIKKECLPFLAHDLGGTVYTKAGKLSLLKALRKPKNIDKDAFFQKSRWRGVMTYFVTRICRFINIDPIPPVERERIPFVDGWYYSHVVGKIDDLDRGHGEEL